jgi:hypothetical protein
MPNEIMRQEGPRINMSLPQSISAQRTVVESETQQLNFLRRTCELCQKEVLLAAGDVLYGEGWYHAGCWENLRGSLEDTSETR